MYAAKKPEEARLICVIYDSMLPIIGQVYRMHNDCKLASPYGSES